MSQRRQSDLIDEAIKEEVKNSFKVSRGLQLGLFFILTVLWGVHAGIMNSLAPFSFIIVLGLSWFAQSTLRDHNRWQHIEAGFVFGESILLALFLLLGSEMVGTSSNVSTNMLANDLRWPWVLLFVIQIACIGLSGARLALAASLAGALICQTSLLTLMTFFGGSISWGIGSGIVWGQQTHVGIATVALGLIATATVPFVFWRLEKMRHTNLAKILKKFANTDKCRAAFGLHPPLDLAKALTVSQDAFETYSKPKKKRASVLIVILNERERLAEACKGEEFVKVIDAFRMEAAKLAAMRNGYAVPLGAYGVVIAFDLLWPDRDNAASAVRTALDLKGLLSSKSLNGRHISCSMGLHTGVTIGSVNPNGVGYFIGGPCVDTATRLADMCPAWQCQMILSHTSKTLAGEGFKAQSLGTTAITGQAEAMTIYKLL